MNTNATFSTTNRHLENFLFMHRIRFLSYGKNEDGTTFWVYDNNPEFQEVLDEYKRIYPRGFAS